MSKFREWCATDEETVKGHELSVLTALDAKRDLGLAAVAAVVPAHYASEERVINILKTLGKPAAAKYLEQKLPETKQIRSGDLGEILAATYVVENTTYLVPVKRLRWKDHRNMAMRGDDLIALRINPDTFRVEFLKSEIKSRISLSKSVLDDARIALRKDNNRPSPHALSFIVDRLYETEQTDLADKIEMVQLRGTIKLSEVEHLLFAVSGNDPTRLLKDNLERYRGRVHQRSVGLQIEAHPEFVNAVYEAVIAHAHHR